MFCTRAFRTTTGNLVGKAQSGHVLCAGGEVFARALAQLYVPLPQRPS
jgi:hypothetical protein